MIGLIRACGGFNFGLEPEALADRGGETGQGGRVLQSVAQVVAVGKDIVSHEHRKRIDILAQGAGVEGASGAGVGARRHRGVLGSLF